MLLQTNSYIVPSDKRAEHARLMKRFKQTLARLGCDRFEVHEQVGNNWSNTSRNDPRFVQIMRFRDRGHHRAVQEAERSDPAAQELIAEFCALVDFEQQQTDGLYAVGFYSSVLPVADTRAPHSVIPETAPALIDESQPIEVLPVETEPHFEQEPAPLPVVEIEQEPQADEPELEPELQPEEELEPIAETEIEDEQQEEQVEEEIEEEEQPAEQVAFDAPAAQIPQPPAPDPQKAHAPGSNGKSKEPAKPSTPAPRPAGPRRPSVTVVPHRGVQMFTIPLGPRPGARPQPPNVPNQTPPSTGTNQGAAASLTPAQPGNAQPQNPVPGAFPFKGAQTPRSQNQPQDPNQPNVGSSFTVGRLSRL